MKTEGGRTREAQHADSTMFVGEAAVLQNVCALPVALPDDEAACGYGGIYKAPSKYNLPKMKGSRPASHE